jgi:Pathogenicity locus
MNPYKVDRSRVSTLTDLPNIGKAGAKDLELLGIHTPEQLKGQCPFEMYASSLSDLASVGGKALSANGNAP